MDKLFTTGIVKEISVESRSLTAYASTGDLDRQGEIIAPQAWQNTIRQFPSVPLLWAHDYRIPPIGRATDFQIDSKGLKFRAEFATTDFANEIWGLYRDQYLNSFSVGFIPKQAQEGQGPVTYTDTELLEVSSVPVPANPFATVERGVITLAFKSVESFTRSAEEAPSQEPPHTEPITDDIEPAATDDDTELTPEQLAALAAALYALNEALEESQLAPA